MSELIPNLHPCLARLERRSGFKTICGKIDPDKPAIFRGEDWCCDNHRKILQDELPSNS